MMRAILFATGESPGLGTLNGLYPAPLLPFLDRPFLRHVVEWLAARGFREFDVYACHLAEQVEALLGDGVRWGVVIRHHLVRQPGRAYWRLQSIDPPIGGDPVLLAHADRLPAIDDFSSREGLYQDREGNWTGWAWIEPLAEPLGQIPGGLDEPGFLDHLTRQETFRPIEVDPVLDVRSHASYLDSQRRALRGQFLGLMPGAVEVEPAVWISRNVSIHPKASIVPPVYFGEDCQVGEGSRVGPDTVIGEGCILDRRSTIADTSIFPGTYVGEGVELEDAIAVGGLLVHVGMKSEVAVGDRYLLDGLAQWKPTSRLQGAFSRSAAALLILAFGPVLLGSIAWKWVRGCKPILEWAEFARLPGSTGDRPGGTFALPGMATVEGGQLDDWLCRVLPGLVSVLRGDLRLVGVTPRSLDELSTLPPDWRSLYQRSYPGLITESSRSLSKVTGNPAEEVFAADAYYAASACLGHDIRLLLEYLAGIVREQGAQIFPTRNNSAPLTIPTRS